MHRMLAFWTMVDEGRVSFSAFVMSLSTTAAVHLGEIPDPVTGASVTDLAAAGQLIDVLSMLEEKTKGNLTPDEQEFMEGVLYELRLRFVEAKDKGEKRIIEP